MVATGGATFTVDSSGRISITALAPGAVSTVTVTATREGYTTTSAQTTGSALVAGTTPTFSTPRPTAGGFTFDNTNYLPSVTDALAASAGATATIDASGHVTVTGLVPVATARVSVTA